MLQTALFTPAVTASTDIGAKFKLAVVQLSNNMPFAYKFLKFPSLPLLPTMASEEEEENRHQVQWIVTRAVKYWRESPSVPGCHLCSHQTSRTVAEFSFENS